MTSIPFCPLERVNAPIASALEEAVRAVIDSGVYINGPRTRAFELGLAEVMRARHAVGLGSGLDALRLSLEALKRLGRLAGGDGIIVPANTYIASFLAVTHAGLRVMPADVDPRTMLLTAAEVRRLAAAGARGVMPVHLYGRVCGPEVYDAARECGLVVVDDCAQAIGAEGAGRRADVAALSFYPTKNVGALGDAGAVVTDSEDIAREVRSLGYYGVSEPGIHAEPGFNSRIGELQAALLSVKLPLLGRESERRREVARAYNSELQGIPGIVLPEIPDDERTHVWHQYVVRVSPAFRTELRRRLEAMGVGTGAHYPVACHRQPCYRGCFDGLSLPVAEALCDSVMSLPIAAVTLDEVSQVAASLRSALLELRSGC